MSQDGAHLSPRQRLQHWLEHLAHVLPAQAPIRNFVHHNTLHGFQHLPFAEALAAAHALTAARPYWSENNFQRAFASGRITSADLRMAMLDAGLAGLDEALLAGLRREDVLLAALLVAAEMPEKSRQRWLAQETRGVNELLLARSRQLTDSTLATNEDWQATAARRCQDLFDRLGQGATLRQLLLHLTGEDVLERVRDILQHHLAAHLDQGLAAWTNPAQAAGFYAAWRASAVVDPAWDLDDLPNVRQEILELPESAVDVLLAGLPQILPDESRWLPYLESLSLELPGWSGMFLWRHRQCAATAADGVPLPVDMAEYLAVRLVLEQLLSKDLVQRLSGASMSPDELRQYFMHRPAEFYVRDALAGGDLPEDLLQQARRLVDGEEAKKPGAAEWLRMAEEIARERLDDRDNVAFRLAVLLEQLALPAEQLASLTPDDATALLSVATLDELQRGHLWLLAYEHHYREAVFTALHCNAKQRDKLAESDCSAQVVFCMDDREEGTRRHLEEIAPQVATYGAAGFFGIAMYWQGIDDPSSSALCPVVVQPAHVVQEVADDFDAAVKHAGRREIRLHWRESLLQLTRRDALFGPLLTLLAAVPSLLLLLGQILLPATFGKAIRRWRKLFETSVKTHLEVTTDDARSATAEQPRHGFTTEEQVERVEAFLRTIGLTGQFAPLVLMLGHGSGSQNNPHLSAYDCGACSGRHGGPNARVFAAMANRPAVRAGLRQRGLEIPDGCWFVGAEHNTCDDSIEWYDLEQVPSGLQAALDTLLAQMAEACRAHAVERCRRLASAPLGLSPWQAMQHVSGRLHDISQARPELGHANNATAIVGRRAMTQGLFLDRRAFLVSYDPAADATGDILEKILLAVGPVGAGINLEYYFSTVDNQRFGCGSKITHNLTGLFGVMEGADSDLRTGLPWQMVEIHEPMRLLVVVEQTPAVLGRILNAQPALQELINNAWIILAAQDPTTAEIHRYCPRRGWLAWSGKGVLPQVARSLDWFGGERGALGPALLLGGIAG